MLARAISAAIDGNEIKKNGYSVKGEYTIVSAFGHLLTLKDPEDWEDHEALLDYGFATFPTHLLARSGKAFRTVAVEGSLLPQVETVIGADVTYPLAEVERVRVRVTLPTSVQAPIRRGTIAGKLIFQVGEETVGETYLLYGADVPSDLPGPTLLERLSQLLRGKDGRSVLTAFCLNR